MTTHHVQFTNAQQERAKEATDRAARVYRNHADIGILLDALDRAADTLKSVGKVEEYRQARQVWMQVKYRRLEAGK